MNKKQLYTLEYLIRCSTSILYEFVATNTGLQEWFADKVVQRNNRFYFYWGNDEPQEAELIEKEVDKFIRFRWLKGLQEEYFEFRIDKTELTNQTVFIITDFAPVKEIPDQKRLWEHQIKNLFYRVGIH